jgi:uncharacterized protein (DUF1501 family)
MTISRRSVLKGAAAGGFLAGVAPMRATLAAAATDQRLVVYILRGAMDGLAALPPYADPSYRTARGNLAMPGPGEANGMLDLDGFFGIHPNLSVLRDWYAEGAMAFLHASHSAYRERSHFDGQDLLENGTTQPMGATTGWLNRAITALGPSTTRLGLAVGNGVPLTLRGQTPVTAYQPQGLAGASQQFLNFVSRLYAKDALLDQAYKDGLATKQLVNGVLGSGTTTNNSPAGLAAAAGRLLAAIDGPRMATLELGGWDTHANQGLATGQLANVFTTLNESLAALRENLGPAWAKTSIVVLTEFGRTVLGNGSGGSDHGMGSVTFVAGGPIAGKRRLGGWPGLAAAQLYEGRDLAPLNDQRSVLKALLRQQFGLSETVLSETVFPGSAAVPSFGDLVKTGVS